MAATRELRPFRKMCHYGGHGEAVHMERMPFCEEAYLEIGGAGPVPGAK